MFNLIFLSNYQRVFSNQGHNRLTNACGGETVLEMLYCTPWIRDLRHRKFQNELLNLIHHAIQTLILHNYQLIFFHQVLQGHAFSFIGVLN